MNATHGGGAPEARSPLSDPELYVGFRKGEIDARTVMLRVLDKAARLHRAEEALPLLGVNGQEVLAEDYMTPQGLGKPSYAEKHHALPTLLGFLLVDEGASNFPITQSGIAE